MCECICNTKQSARSTIAIITVAADVAIVLLLRNPLEYTGTLLHIYGLHWLPIIPKYIFGSAPLCFTNFFSCSSRRLLLLLAVVVAVSNFISYTNIERCKHFSHTITTRIDLDGKFKCQSFVMLAEYYTGRSVSGFVRVVPVLFELVLLWAKVFRLVKKAAAAAAILNLFI